MAKKKLNPKLDKFLKIFIVMVLVVVSFKVMVANQWTEKDAEGDNKNLSTTREDFVMCLKESGLIMYGDNTCEFCRQQKKMFGSQFEDLNYVNCQFEKEICENKGISVYPVWEFKGKRAIGIQNFEQLSQLTNCPQPNN